MERVRTLAAALRNSAEKYPDNPALGYVNGETLTYHQLLEMVEGVSLLLSQHGIQPGDAVALIGENMPHWGVAYFAVTSMGAVVVPILQEFHDDAVHHIVRHSEAKAVFASRRYLPKVEEGHFPDLKTIILLDDFSVEQGEEHATTFSEARHMAREKLARLKKAARKLVDRPEPDKAADIPIKGDDLAAILYTSGTSGHSKGVMLTHWNIVSDALSGWDLVRMGPEDRMVSVLPMAHAYECTLGLVLPILSGASVSYLSKPPSPKTLLPAMEKVRPTFLLMVPLIMEKIYKKRIKPKLTGKAMVRGLMKLGPVRRKISKVAGQKLMEAFGGQIKFLGIGGAALAPEVERFLRDAEVPYAIGYGLTEAAPCIAGCVPAKTKYRSTGPAMPGVTLKINDPSPVTGEGEIWAKGPNIMVGYHKGPKYTEEVLTADGWLKTGDLGVMDEDGFVFIKGRIKNVIVGSSGENIYPEEVESLVTSCNYVLESLVMSRGDQLIARVHLNYEALDEDFDRNGLTESAFRDKVDSLLEGIRTEVNAKVSSFSRLARVVEQTEPFEKTPTQKIKRFLYVDQ